MYRPGGKRLRLSPWVALIFGTFLLGRAFVDKGALIVWTDVAPGVGLLAAGVFLFFLFRRIDRQHDDPAE